MSDDTPRVVLLARDGDARAKLDAALREAGAEVALVLDPTTAQPDEAAAVSPGALLVALDAGVEDALERWQALLADPAITVVFDEAEVAAAREGWDAARWVRHLSAKLRRHDDVLPPGGEKEDLAWQPDPGPLSRPRAEIEELDLAAFTGEALELAAEVPRGEGLDPGPPVFTATDATALALVDADADAVVDLDADADAAPDAPSADGLEALALDDDDAAATAIISDGIVADGELDWSSVTTAIEVDPALAGDLEALAGALDDGDAAADADAEALAWSPGVRDDALLFDGAFDAAVPVDRADDDDRGDGRDGEDDGDRAPAAPAIDFDALASSLSLDAGDGPIAPTTGDDPDAAARIAALGSSLSLADDAGPLAAAPVAAAGYDIDALEDRVAGLSLADTDSYGHGPERGAVLVDGGLGGPDAVRQLLAGLPATLPRPVLVRLHLDGGRYDRLVKQMERASALPVALATAGAPVEPGIVYFLAPDTGLLRDRGALRFAALDGDGSAAEAVLPPSDSAWLVLSGSDGGVAATAAGWLADGALVAAQVPETCYDPLAAQALVDAGADADEAAALATRIGERWPS